MLSLSKDAPCPTIRLGTGNSSRTNYELAWLQTCSADMDTGAPDGVGKGSGGDNAGSGAFRASATYHHAAGGPIYLGPDP